MDNNNITFKEGVANIARREIRYHNGECCPLSGKETEVLSYLAAHPDRAVSRDELLLQIWGLNPKGVVTRTIDMHIAHLRDKLHDPHAHQLRTVRGKGYMFTQNGSTHGHNPVPAPLTTPGSLLHMT